MRRINEKDVPFKNVDSGTKYLVKGPKWEGGLVVFKPGQKLGAHWHKEVEETFYFLEGEGKIFINGAEYPAQPGGVYQLEPGEKHDILNNGKENLKAIFIKCPYLPEDKVME